MPDSILCVSGGNQLSYATGSMLLETISKSRMISAGLKRLKIENPSTKKSMSGIEATRKRRWLVAYDFSAKSKSLSSSGDSNELLY